LKNLYAGNAAAKSLGVRAKAVLVFPSIVEGGFMVGGQYGEGALRKGNRTAGYYSSIDHPYPTLEVNGLSTPSRQARRRILSGIMSSVRGRGTHRNGRKLPLRQEIQSDRIVELLRNGDTRSFGGAKGMSFRVRTARYA